MITGKLAHLPAFPTLFLSERVQRAKYDIAPDDVRLRSRFAPSPTQTRPSWIATTDGNSTWVYVPSSVGCSTSTHRTFGAAPPRDAQWAYAPVTAAARSTSFGHSTPRAH